MSLDETLDKIEEKWPLIAAAVLALVLGLSAYIAKNASFGMADGMTIAILFGISLLLKYPGRYSSVGGTDVDTVMAIIITAAKGPFIGFGFLLALAIIGREISLESPQDTAITIGAHVPIVIVASMAGIGAEDLVLKTMAIVIGSLFILAPLRVMAGAPPRNAAIGAVIKIIWSYAFLRAFGSGILGLLG